MIVSLQIVRPDGSEGSLVLDVGDAYGAEPELALETLTLALVHAERPVVLDAWGRLVEFERGSVRKVVVREQR